MSADILDRIRSHLPYMGAEKDWDERAAVLLVDAMAHIVSLRNEVRTQRAEIGQLINVRNALLDADKPPHVGEVL